MPDNTANETIVAVADVLPAETADGATVEQDTLSAPPQEASPAVPEPSDETPAVSDPTDPIKAVVAMEEAAERNADANFKSMAPPSHHADLPATSDQPSKASPTAEENDTDFVPPDMEHIVSTGAAQDGASSMQALRELVAQVRASSGQPREALPPGFGDDEPEASAATTAQAQRGEKRKAEDELEELVQSSAGIDEVKAAAEKSQHPETKTLLQKALSSISGLVSRRGKAESPAAASAASTSTSIDKTGVQDGAKLPACDEAGAEASNEGDSSSDSDSSSSDSSDDEDEEDKADAGTALAGDDYDEDEGGPIDSTAPATKNEILAPDFEQPAVQQVTETEKQTLRKLGKVHSIVDSVVVVEQDVQQSKPADGSSANAAFVPVDSTGRQGERQGEYSVLDTGSLLCFEDGKVLGLVFETFGSIHNPMYSIRFASAASIDRELIETGKTVFYLPSQSTYVLTQLLRSIKGSDASNMWDEEVADDEIDYSDDEQEAEAKRRAKATRYSKVDDQGNPLPPPSASARGNKRQKQHGAGQSSQPPSQSSAKGYSNQYSRQGGIGNAGFAAGYSSSQQRPPVSSAHTSLPRRSVGGFDLPLPPVPTGAAPLGPAFPHGIGSLPPRPSAGLPSKPTFASESSASSAGHSTDPQAAIGSRSRTATAESGVSALSHSRMNSAATSSLPAKPIDAAAAWASTTPKPSTPSVSPYRAPGTAVGAASPPHASRQALMRAAAPTPAAAYPHPSSPGWYAGAGSASPSTPASPAAPYQHAAARGLTYGVGSAAPVLVQGGGHYNPAYAAHWQPHSYDSAAASAPSAHQGGAAWNGPQQHHSAPLHMALGAMSHQHAYGGHGAAHGSYGAPAAASGAPWVDQTYPGSHYPGYTNRQYHTSAANAETAAAGLTGHGNYVSPAQIQAQAHGYGGYATQGAAADPYNGYVYPPPGAHAATASNATPSSATQDSYDPRSPLMGGSSGQNPHSAAGSSQGR